MILAVLVLAACSSLQVEGGVATYDALKKATDQCAAGGGTLRLKKEGDSQYLEDYACERK